MRSWMRRRRARRPRWRRGRARPAPARTRSPGRGGCRACGQQRDRGRHAAGRRHDHQSAGHDRHADRGGAGADHRQERGHAQRQHRGQHDRLHVRGDQHRQRDAQRDRGERCAAGCGGDVRGDHAGAGGEHDLHRHAHDHPGRGGCRACGQQRDRGRHAAGRRHDHQSAGHDRHADRGGAGADHRQERGHAQRQHRGQHDRLHVRGDQHRQRDAQRDRGERCAAGCGGDVRGDHAGAGGEHDLHRHAHDHQAEVDAGHVANSATAGGTPPGGGTTTSPPDTTDTPIAAAPALTIDKSAGTPSGSTAGSTIAYTFVVTNTGNVTLSGIVVNDAQLDAAATCAATTLAPGASTTCTGTHTITQAEVDAGHVANSATAGGTPPGGGTTTSPPDTTDTPIAAAPALTIDKSAGTPSGSTAGSTIAYTFVVTNTGNVTLSGIVVNDAQLDAAATCAATTLAPGASTTCTGTHTITQAEVDAGHVANSATAGGTPPGGGTTTSPPDTTDTPIAAAPALTIDKSAGTPSGSTAGSTIAYTFVVTNTGNVTLSGIVVNDAQLDAAATCAATTLAPGASTTCT